MSAERETPSAGVGRTMAILLRFYPKAFREDYGAAIVQLVRDQRRDLGDESLYRRFQFWLSVMLDTVRAARVEHASAVRPRRVSATWVPRLAGGLLLLAAAANVVVDVVAVKLSMGAPAILSTVAAAGSGVWLIMASRRTIARQ